MGCDIHTYLEVRDDETSEWSFVGDVACSYCLGVGLLRDRTECYFCEGNGKSVANVVTDNGDSYMAGGHPYQGRNYFLFAVLSGAVLPGVRVYDEFYKLVGEDFEPLAHPGVPEDSCLEIQAALDNVDYHSHGHLTYNETIGGLVSLLDPSQGDLVEGVASRLGRFITGCLQLTMAPIAERVGGDNVRLVFAYDN